MSGEERPDPTARPVRALGGDEPNTLRTSTALLLFFAFAALVNAVLIQMLPPSEPGVRLWHHAYDAGQLLTAGLLASAGTEAFSRWAPRHGALRYSVIALVASGVGIWTLGEDVSGMADRLARFLRPSRGQVVLSVLFSLSVPLSAALGSLLSRPVLRFAGAGAAVALLLANPHVLENGYPAMHLFITLAACTLGAASLGGARLPDKLRVPRPVSHGVRLVLCVLAAWSVVSFPSSSVLAELYRLDTAVLAPWVADLHPMRSAEAKEIPRDLSRWFKKREKKRPRPSKGTPLLPADGIVILITVDALRADVIEKAEHRKYSPTLHGLKDTAVYFSNARSFSGGTRVSLGSMFTSRHFSQLPWTNRRTFRPSLERFDGPRLPELLTRGGVTTEKLVAHALLEDDIGVASGFERQKSFIKPGETRHPLASELVGYTIAELEKDSSGPRFLYMHLMDPHAPYDAGGAGKNEFESYLLEVKLVDAEIDRLLRAIQRLGLSERVAVLIGADHGEAFGEHGEINHDKSLHEVQVRVPLFAVVPGAEPRRLDAPVTLLDIAPTVLDLFGRDTPTVFMGETLTPFFRGDDPFRRRVIFLENRSQYALVFPDGIKTIIDVRRKREEVYDLDRDPEEAKNLADRKPELARRYLDLTRTYRKRHEGVQR
jgi:choline-sulfatase